MPTALDTTHHIALIVWFAWIIERKVVHTLMRAILVIKTSVFCRDMVQVRQTEAGKVFEAFSFDGGNPEFRV